MGLMGVAMVDVRLRYVNAQRDRNGRVRYYYFRRRDVRTRLPDKPLSDAFMAAYNRLLDAPEQERCAAAGDKRLYPVGTWGATANDYLGSAGYKSLKPSTQRLYRRILDNLTEEHGFKLMRDLRRRHIRKMRDALAETPGAANNVLRMIKVMCNFAVDDEIIEASPAARMKEFKGGEYRSWTDAECAAFEARWLPGSMQRRAYTIALYTGQRRGDQVAMTRAHRARGFIQVRQEKTDATVGIPEHHELAAELARGEQGHMSLLTTSRGKAFDPIYYGSWFADAIAAAGLPEDCVLHGLRKCAARKLAEAGCSEEEIKSVTGHATTRMVAHYVKDANKQRQASAAILKLENAAGRRIGKQTGKRR